MSDPVSGLLAGAAVGVAGVAGWYRRRRRGLQRELVSARHAATHDPLTGLCNRAGLVQQWPRHAARVPAPVVVVCDLDGFKPVNDTYGHAAGDELLIAVAGRLRRVVPGLVARLGGDEFAAVVHAPDPVAVAYRMAAAVSCPVRLPGGVTVTVNVSVGLSRSPDVDLAVRLGEADAAMYRAKTGSEVVAAFDRWRDDRPAAGCRSETRVRDRHELVSVAARRVPAGGVR